jgi:hypothetical protein
MKNLFKLLGIAALVATIGFSMVACDDGDDNKKDKNPFIGTWKSQEGNSSYAMVFTDKSFTITSPSGDIERGTYTWSGNSASMTISQTGQTLNVTVSGNTLTYGSRTYIKS